jgi:AcrR family transcriptional regulator
MTQQTAVRGLRERNRRTTYARIAAEAARLVTDQGLTGTTVEQIADAADVGRATFFRYFDAKERAVAAGFAGVWLHVITSELERQPPELSPIDAVRATFGQLASHLEEQRELVLLQAELSRSSVALEAWTLQLYVDFEVAIGAILANRFGDLEPADPHPRLVGAMTMAVVRLSLDRWVADGGDGDLAALIDRGLAVLSVEVTPPTQSRAHKESR